MTQPSSPTGPGSSAPSAASTAVASGSQPSTAAAHAGSQPGMPAVAGGAGKPGRGPGSAALTKAIPRRPRVGVLAGLVLAFGFGLLITPTIAIDTWLVQARKLEVSPTSRAAVTVRVPLFNGHRAGALRVEGGGVLVARGEVFGRDRADATAAIFAAAPRGPGFAVAYFLLCAALVAVYAHHLRRSNRGRLLRVQMVNLLTLAGVAVVTKIALLTTTFSVLALPVALAAIVPTLVFDRAVGLATGVLSAVVISLLVPFDVGVATVLVAQAATAGLLVPEAPKRPLRSAAIAGLASAGVAAFIYGVFTFLTTGALPLAELSHPGASAWVAATAGGVIAAALSVLLLPIYQLLVGELTSGRLTQLQDLSQPLLRQIAEKSPGTWQHSLAMANMAEIAANEIGADGRLVRVGAYYHDLGKSLQAKYFIENIQPGETSPHEHLPPEVSCDAIFAHVTEGIVAARRARLHERVIDFMHMHHGNGVLEYFWTKCQRQGNPKQLGIESFRYPGVPPQSRETAILAICDAVEAAARTLKRPDAASIDSLVQRIVYGKLHLGQLDESGLSMADLRRISDSLRETIRHAHHGRIEYPWQQEQARALEQSGGGRGGERQDDRSGERPRLDSLDAPRPPWHSKPTMADGRPRSEAEAMGGMTGATAPTAVLERGGASDPATATTGVAPPMAAPAASSGQQPAQPAPRSSAPPMQAAQPMPRQPSAGGSAGNLPTAPAPRPTPRSVSAPAAIRAGGPVSGQSAPAESFEDASAEAIPEPLDQGTSGRSPEGRYRRRDSSAPVRTKTGPLRTSGLEDGPIGSRVTRRGLGPPPAPAARTTGQVPVIAPLTLDEGALSDPAITAPRITTPRPLAESSLARRIEASISAMDEGLDEGLADELDDSPFLDSHAAAGRERRQPTVMTSAKRAPQEQLFADVAARRAAAEFAAETSPAMPSYPDDADVTSQQPLAEIEQLAAMSVPSRPMIRRPPHDTHEVDPEDIEAAIEVAPPVRRNPGSVVQPLPRAPSKPPK